MLLFLTAITSLKHSKTSKNQRGRNIKLCASLVLETNRHLNQCPLAPAVASSGAVAAERRFHSFSRCRGRVLAVVSSQTTSGQWCDHEVLVGAVNSVGTMITGNGVPCFGSG